MTQDTPITNESEAMEVWRKANEASAELAYVANHDGSCRRATIAESDQAAARVIATALEARDARISELEGALGELIHTAGEVHRLGARIGAQWFRLSGSLIGARAILTKGNTHD